MGFIHVVLIWGTNNLNLDAEGFELTARREWERSMGARMVLGARIFYALFIWASKFTVSEFLKRITIRIWKPSYERTLHGIRVFLVVTFIAVMLATLLECRPFNNYWQVTPDPGPKCRQNFAQLITMGTADIITDILLVVFPIPIVLRSGQSVRRKLALVALFSLSLLLIGITATRVPEVISHRGRQQYRTVWASCEILASTAVSNALIIGAFLRDKGTKKNKYKATSVTDSIDRSSMRRPTASTLQGIGSDEDLFRNLGLRIPEHLQSREENVARLAGPAPPVMSSPFARTGSIFEMRNVLTEGPGGERYATDSPGSGESDGHRSPKSMSDDNAVAPSPGIKKQVSFFDIGGLLEDNDPSVTRSRSITITNNINNPSTIAQDFAPLTPEHSRSRRGSRAFTNNDFSGRLTPTQSHLSITENFSRQPRRPPQGTLTSIPQHGNPSLGLGTTPELQQQENWVPPVLTAPLVDAGGLLLKSQARGPGASAPALGRVAEREGNGAGAVGVPRWEDSGIEPNDAGGLLLR